jgi:hypothetical protein
LSMRLMGTVNAHGPQLVTSPAARAPRPAQQRAVSATITCLKVDAPRDAGTNDIAVIGPSDSRSPLCGPDAPSRNGETGNDLRSPWDLAELIRSGAPFAGDDPCVIHLTDGSAGPWITPPPELCPGAPKAGVRVHHGSGREPGLGVEIEQLVCSPKAAGRRLTSGLTALAERISAGGGRLSVRPTVG